MRVTDMEAELMSQADLTPAEALAKSEAESEKKNRNGRGKEHGRF